MSMLEPLRIKRRKLAQELLEDASNREVEAIAAAEGGEVSAFRVCFCEFYCSCCGQRTDTPQSWRSDNHREFYNLCRQIANLEQTTYNALRKETV
jgi:hypothetical protein